MERKNFLKSKVLFFVVFAIFFSIASAVFVVKAGTEHNVSGWLWSGTDDGFGISTGVGWIATNNLDFSGTTNYGTSIPEGDNLVTGYLWSENIGWIDFQPSGPYPVEPNSGVRREGNKLIGWARILSIKDAGINSGGWEGWIKLSGLAQDGSSYGVEINPTTSKLSGYGWSDELGWIDFSRSVINIVPPLPPLPPAPPSDYRIREVIP